jgi:hypothetical protein
MSDDSADIEPAEDDGVIQPTDGLTYEDVTADILDTGVDAGEGYRAATRFGTTAEEAFEGESLDDLLSEEEPEPALDPDWTDEDEPLDDGATAQPRTGRLLQPDEGAHADEESEAIAQDIGIDGGAASAEEAAMHLTDEPPFD